MAWILVLGPSGSGKGLVADFLSKEGYEKQSSFYAETDKPRIYKELKTMTDRLRGQMLAGEEGFRKDIVTIRSIWDTRNCIHKALAQLSRIGDGEVDLLETIYQGCQDLLPVPNMVVAMRVRKEDAFNRISMSGREVDQDFHMAQAKLYEEFYERITVPKIELNASDKPDIIRKNLEFGIANIRAANLQSKSIWAKSFLYE